jgi:hypothetical protein
MPKVKLFSGHNVEELTLSINNFIIEHKLEAECIHDIKMSSGSDNIVVMLIYMEYEEEPLLDDDFEQFSIFG